MRRLIREARKGRRFFAPECALSQSVTTGKVIASSVTSTKLGFPPREGDETEDVGIG
jgi:hypothetical protein